MAKRIVCTIKVSIDTNNPNEYKMDVRGNGAMPAKELADCLATVALHFKNSEGTMEEHFKSNQDA